MPSIPSTPTPSPVVPDPDHEQITPLRAAAPLLATMVVTLLLAVAIIALAAIQAPVVGEVSAILVA